ncbi:hypothetical protein BaRGS_00013221 [Batillaria attramentaria]|uniref:Uncharacterized protein n=1 Tax=Batillaria attramentaria TaxID=370345 RepID=A0ABD0L8M5_9CAEN
MMNCIPSSFSLLLSDMEYRADSSTGVWVNRKEVWRMHDTFLSVLYRKRRAATATATVEVSERSPTTPQKAAKPRKPRKAKKAANGKKATREDWKPTSRKSLVSSALYVDGCSLGGQHYDAFRKNPDDDNPYSELYEIQVIYDN